MIGRGAVSFFANFVGPTKYGLSQGGAVTLRPLRLMAVENTETAKSVKEIQREEHKEQPN